MVCSKKNIIIVSPTLDPQNISGVSSVVRFIIKNNQNVKYLHFELGKKNKEKGGFFRITRLFRSFIKWNTLLLKNKNSLIHYNFPITRKSVVRDTFFMLFARLHSCKIVIHLHGGNYLMNNKTPFWVSWLLKKIFSMEAPIIVLSNEEKIIIEQRFHAKKVYSVPNCVEYDLNYEKDSFLKNNLTILYLGRIVETKGLSYMLDAFKILKKEGIPFNLIIAGEEERNGRYINQFRNALGSSFTYAGIVVNSEKEKLLKESNIFLLPSFYEGLPLSLLESMSYGLVPIVTNVGSVGSCVNHNINGIIIKKCSSKDIVNAVTYLHKNRDKLSEFSANSRKKIVESFDPKVYIDKLNKIYSSVI